MSAGAAAALRVLVVDDNPMNIDLVRTVLELDGVQVDSATDAEQALQQIRRQPPDLVLMDIQLPGTDGLALTRRLRQDPATAGLVIVAFTAYAMKGDAQRMLAAGCDGYLAKPIDVRRFAAQVRALAQPPHDRAAHP